MTLHLQRASTRLQQGASLIGRGGRGAYGVFQTSAARAPMNHSAPGSACARGCEACLSKLLFTWDDPVGPGAATKQRHCTQTRHAFFIGRSSSASEHTDTLRRTTTHTPVIMDVCQFNGLIISSCTVPFVFGF